MPIFVEWRPEHIVEDNLKMMCNQQWAEGIYRLLREGGVAMTAYGPYFKRDGGLYQTPRAPLIREAGEEETP